MTDTFRFRSLVALSLGLSLVLAPFSKAEANHCSLAGAGHFTTALDLVQKSKMDRDEFGRLPILPSKSSLLSQGTALNAVVDLECLKDPSRGTRRFEWLNELAASKPAGTNARAYSWRLERDWDFYLLQTEIEAEPCLEMVSPERRYYMLSTFNDPMANEQSHLSRIGYDNSVRSFLLAMMTRPKVVIAIVDTGVDFAHPDLAWNQWLNPGEVGGNGVDDDRNGYIDDFDGFNFASGNSTTGPEGDWPDNRHGTHVAGLAAGRIDNGEGGSGVAGIAKVMSLNVFGATGYSRSSILENAIRYAADQGADVINMSLGGREYSRTMQSALEYAIRKGSFIVTAAGNDGIELCDDPTSFDFVSPAIYSRGLEGMIAVGSTDSGSGRFSSFSNYSPAFVEIAAPGAFSSSTGLLGLLSTLPDGKYGYLAGTSMAAPITSGAVALAITWLKANQHSITPGRLEAILKAGSRRDSGLRDAVQEGRVLDLNAMIAYLRANYPAPRH
ncbi:MAG: S8 family serine peptidase [Bdellovibrionota bacterium]